MRHAAARPSPVSSALVTLALVLGVATGIAGCRKASAAPPEPKSPEEAAFRAADAKLDRFESQEFFGNTPEAKERAEAFAIMVKTFQSVLDANARGKDETFEQVQARSKVLTHCEMRDGRIAFLANVPGLDRMSPSAREGLLGLASSAATAAMIDLDDDAFTVAIGLRGASGYVAVATGPLHGDNKPQGVESLHAFFGGEPFKGPSLADRRRAFEESRGPDPSSPPMLPGQPRGRHPSVGQTDHSGRTGMAVAIAPKIWVVALHLVPRGNGPFAIVDAEGRRRVVEVMARRDCEAYAWEMAFLDKPYVPTTLARVATPGSTAFLYGVGDDGKPMATPASITPLAIGGRGPLITDLELGARDLGRPLFDAQDRFVGLACNVEPNDPPQLLAVGDVREFLEQDIELRERNGV